MTSWVMAPGSQLCLQTLPGMAGVAFFWQALWPWARLGKAEFLGVRKRQLCESRLVCGSLPATAPASPGYQGYQHLPAWLLFVLALSPWGCWHSQLGSPGSEECVWFICWTLWPRKNLIPAWEDLQVYVLTAQTFFYNFFHFSYLRKLGLILLLHSFSRCV